MATQNPIETEGTYPLPEAQVDRFMMKVLVGYPSEEEEFVIVERVTGVPADVATVATTEQLAALQRQCRNGYVDPSLIQYAVRLAIGDAQPDRYGVEDFAKYVTFGASPRASIHLIEGARALAFLRGRDYVLPRRRQRPRARRAAPSPRAVVRGARRRPDARPARPPHHAADPAAREAARDACSDRVAGLNRAQARNVVALPARNAERVAAPPRVDGDCAGSTACCTATTARCSAASGSISPTCANTSTTTTSGTSTGT